jgi:NADH dehydrogenase FAD-containing subunit
MSETRSRIVIAGHCAALHDPIRKQACHPMPMGEVAGDNISRLLRDRPLKRFRPAR